MEYKPSRHSQMKLLKSETFLDGGHLNEYSYVFNQDGQIIERHIEQNKSGTATLQVSFEYE